MYVSMHAKMFWFYEVLLGKNRICVLLMLVLMSDNWS